jgi:HEAT repeat protein
LEELFNLLLDMAQREPRVEIEAVGGILRLDSRRWLTFRRFPEFLDLMLRWVREGEARRALYGLLMLSQLGREQPEALKKLLTPERRTALLHHLQVGMEHPDRSVGLRSIEVVGYLRERSVVPRLIELLRDEDSMVRLFVVEALGRIGDRRALPALQAVAANDPVQDSQGRFHVRERARWAIKQIQRGP